MIVYNELNAVDQKKCVLTIGTFDGVHLGHQSIIHELCNFARQSKSCATVVTFEPHPQFVLRPDKLPELKLLTTLNEKISILEQAGLDRLIVIPFTKKFAALTSQQFIEKILIHKIGFNKLIIGYDHVFGKDREGNLNVLQQLSQKYNYAICQMPPFIFDGVIISSTKIRKLLTEGLVDQAAKYMGRNYRISGIVVKGEGRGRNYKIPTANLKPLFSEKIIPGSGIYAGWMHWKQNKFKAIIYIGTKPTFSYDELTIEVYIFEFTEKIYNEILVIEFVAKLRDDQKFGTAELLYQQIELDKKNTLELLTNKYFL